MPQAEPYPPNDNLGLQCEILTAITQEVLSDAEALDIFRFKGREFGTVCVSAVDGSKKVVCGEASYPSGRVQSALWGRASALIWRAGLDVILSGIGCVQIHVNIHSHACPCHLYWHIALLYRMPVLGISAVYALNTLRIP